VLERHGSGPPEALALRNRAALDAVEDAVDELVDFRPGWSSGRRRGRHDCRERRSLMRSGRIRLRRREQRCLQRGRLAHDERRSRCATARSRRLARPRSPALGSLPREPFERSLALDPRAQHGVETP
jgi:hypothetical protein